MIHTDIILIEAREHYQKKSYRNKCQLIGPNGTHSFSVPLQKGKHNATPIQDVRISYDDLWSNQFLKLCQSNYRKSPFYDFVIDDLSSIFNQNHEFLFDLNMSLLNWFSKFLEFDAAVELTDSYLKEVDPDIEDLRESFKPNKAIINQSMTYPQVFLEKHGFIGNMSILDLIFCCGKESVNYL